MADTERKKWLHSMGVCVQCRNIDAYTMTGRWYCAECSEKRVAYMARHRVENREEINQKHREYIMEKISGGVCRECKNVTYNGTTYCRYHLTMHRNQQRKQREKKQKKLPGECLWCSSQAEIGKKYCAICLQKKADIIRRNRKTPNENHPWKSFISGLKVEERVV